jgi:hypothetical protein
MPSLSDLQGAMRDALLGGDDRAAAAAVRADGIAPAARLALYRHHVFTTLTAALEATFPVVCRLVDRRFFGYAADRYIREHPPAGPCLFEYGADFAEFLDAFAPARPLPFLGDVARLEWALNRAIHADDVQSVDLGALRAVRTHEVARLVLGLDPSLSLVRSAWPVDAIWRVNQPDVDTDTPVDLAAGAVYLETRRAADDAAFRALDVPTWWFRNALAARRTVGDAVEIALATDPAFDVAVAIHDLFADGVVVDFEKEA